MTEESQPLGVLDAATDVSRVRELEATPSPLGVIKFGDGTGAVIIDEDPTGLITVRFSKDIPPAPEGRVETISNFDSYDWGVIPDASPKLLESPTLDRFKKIRISYETKEGAYKRIHEEEEDFLAFLTGERGRLLLFDEGSLPELAVIVLRGKEEAERVGRLYIFYPEDGDSIRGFATFLNALSSELEREIKIPQNREFLTKLGKDLDDMGAKGKISPAQKAVFKARMVAHIRMREVSDDLKYLVFPNTHYIPRSIFKPSEVKNVNKAIEGLINPSLGAEEAVVVDLSVRYPDLKMILPRLKTTEMLTLREMVDGHIGEIHPAMENYLGQLLIAPDADSSYHIEDAIRLLEELSESKFSRANISWSKRRSDQRVLLSNHYDEYNQWGGGFSNGTGSQLIEGILEEAYKSLFALLRRRGIDTKTVESLARSAEFKLDDVMRFLAKTDGNYLITG